MHEIKVNKKSGRPKGVEKTVGSGRKKGSRNKIKREAVIAVEDLNLDDVLNPTRRANVLNKLYRRSIAHDAKENSNGVTNTSANTASKFYLEHCDNYIMRKLNLELDVTTTRSILQSAQAIMSKVRDGELSFKSGEILLNMLEKCKNIKIAVLNAAAEKALDKEIDDEDNLITNE